jgi:hypothetical protein
MAASRMPLVGCVHGLDHALAQRAYVPVVTGILLRSTRQNRPKTLESSILSDWKGRPYKAVYSRNEFKKAGIQSWGVSLPHW